MADDNDINRAVLRRQLTAEFGAALTIDCVANGEEAANAVAATTYDLVVMDIEMPILDGLGATRAIRQREAALGLHPPLPIIGLSGNARQVRSSGRQAACACERGLSMMRLGSLHAPLQEHIDVAMTAGMSSYVSKPYDKATMMALIAGLTGMRSADQQLAN